MKNTIVNLTPHAIMLANEAGEVVETFAPSGEVARMSTSQEKQFEIDGAPVVKTVYGEVAGLPEPQDGVFYLVSSLIAGQVKRPDVISPDTFNGVVRDESGRVKAVRQFQTF